MKTNGKSLRYGCLSLDLVPQYQHFQHLLNNNQQKMMWKRPVRFLISQANCVESGESAEITIQYRAKEHERLAVVVRSDSSGVPNFKSILINLQRLDF